jgi:peptidase M28-like protein
VRSIFRRLFEDTPLFTEIAPPSETKAPPKDPLTAENMMRLVTELAVGHKDRVFGTKEGYHAAKYLRSEMMRVGLKPALDDSYLQRFGLELEDHTRTGQNVVGILPGTDPVLKNEYVLVTAHYDIVQSTHEGANDNATGCAGVIAIAEELKKNPPKRTVVFMTFDGEEGLNYKGDYYPGRKGSRYYAANPIFPFAKTAMMVNMDELGKVHLETKPRDAIYQWSSNDVFARRILAKATEKTDHLGKSINGYPEQPEEAQFFTTDAEPLYRVGVPIINLLSGRYFLNHTPDDDMRIMSPERMEQYVRRGYQCVVDAANDPEPLNRMGITPGGLMPTYPLIRERKSAAQHISEEERLRLSSLYARMPALKAAADKAMAVLEEPAFRERLERKTGFDIGDKEIRTEATLARVRDARKAMVESYRELPKEERGARSLKRDAIDFLGAVENILAGGIYVSMFSGGDYFMQQVPSCLFDLRQGARRIGRGDLVEEITDADTVKFSANASADRAVFMARESLPGLQHALLQAVYALVDPNQARNTEHAATAKDLTAVLARASKIALEKLGIPRNQERELKEIMLVFAFIEATIGSVKASPQKWLYKFAETNLMQDFVGFAHALEAQGTGGANLERLARELEDAIAGTDARALEQAIRGFYGALTEHVGGEEGRAGSLEAIASLGKQEIRERLKAAAIERERDSIDFEALAKAESDPDVQALLQLAQLVKETLDLRKLFTPVDTWRVTLRQEATLQDVKDQIDAVRAAAVAVQGGDTIEKELEFWSKWITPFIELDGPARSQAKARKRAADHGIAAIVELYEAAKPTIEPELEISKKDRESPYKLVKAIQRKIQKAKEKETRDPRAEAAFRKFAPIANALGALERLSAAASAEGRKTFADMVPLIANQFGDEATAKLVEVNDRLSAAWAGAEIEMGRTERSGPMAILKVRAQNRKVA